MILVPDHSVLGSDMGGLHGRHEGDVRNSASARVCVWGGCSGAEKV
jgi:hypothetical protein